MMLILKNMALSMLNFFLLFFTCCNSIEKSYEISTKNPTEYIFPCSIDSIKIFIKMNFSHGEFYGLDLAYKEDALITKIFDKPSNYNDFILEEFSTWHKCKSKVYFNKDNEAHIYHATYQLHLEKLSNTQTKISIIITESGIIYKTKLPVLPHLNRVYKLKEIPPTSVEEYEILLLIGKGLGIKDMPPLKIPRNIIIKL